MDLTIKIGTAQLEAALDQYVDARITGLGCAKTKKKCSRTEVFASLDIILPNRKGVHELKIKMDTGAEGNTLPLRTFQQMFPEHVHQNGQSRSDTKQKETAVLTAYNGSSIPVVVFR